VKCGGFVEVVEHYDLGQAAMTGALKTFGDKVQNADWAVVYFIGYGIATTCWPLSRNTSAGGVLDHVHKACAQSDTHTCWWTRTQ
jgi:uncharacterized caspase-like protein